MYFQCHSGVSLIHEPVETVSNTLSAQQVVVRTHLEGEEGLGAVWVGLLTDLKQEPSLISIQHS